MNIFAQNGFVVATHFQAIAAANRYWNRGAESEASS